MPLLPSKSGTANAWRASRTIRRRLCATYTLTTWFSAGWRVRESVWAIRNGRPGDLQAIRRRPSARTIEQYLAAYPFEAPRFRGRPLDIGRITNRLARGLVDPHRARGCRAGHSAAEIDRAAVPV